MQETRTLCDIGLVTGEEHIGDVRTPIIIGGVRVGYFDGCEKHLREETATTLSALELHGVCVTELTQNDSVADTEPDLGLVEPPAALQAEAEQYPCTHKDCGMVFDKPGRLNYHKRSHAEGKELCNVRPCVGKPISNMKKHLKDVHNVPA